MNGVNKNTITCSLVLALLVCSPVYAQDQNRYNNFSVIAESSRAYFSISSQKFNLKKENGDVFFGAIMRINYKEEDNVGFLKTYVKVSDCERGHGSMFSQNVNDNFANYADWVEGSGTIFSIFARHLCATVKKEV